MLGGYQILDFGGMDLLVESDVKIPFNLRDYTDKPLRLTGINLTISNMMFDERSILIMTTILRDKDIKITTAFQNFAGDVCFLSMTQLEAHNDFEVDVELYTV